MRVADAVRVPSFVHGGLPAYLEQWHAGGGIHIRIATAHDALVAGPRDERINPIVVTESNAHHEVSAPNLIEIAWTRIESLGIGASGHDRFHHDQIAAHRLGRLREIGCRPHDAKPGRRSTSGPP